MGAWVFEPRVSKELSGRLAKKGLLLEAPQKEERTEVLADPVRGERRGVVLHDSKESGHGRCHLCVCGGEIKKHEPLITFWGKTPRRRNERRFLLMAGGREGKHTHTHARAHTHTYLVGSKEACHRSSALDKCSPRTKYHKQKSARSFR